MIVDGSDKGGFTYRDPAPYLLVTVSGDCSVASQIVSFPGKAHTLRLKSGYGSADLSAAFSNGMLTSVGQKTDTKASETIAALGSFASGVGAAVKALGISPSAGASPPACASSAGAHLFAISDIGGIGPDKVLVRP